MGVFGQGPLGELLAVRVEAGCPVAVHDRDVDCAVGCRRRVAGKLWGRYRPFADFAGNPWQCAGGDAVIRAAGPCPVVDDPNSTGRTQHGNQRAHQPQTGHLCHLERSKRALRTVVRPRPASDPSFSVSFLASLSADLRVARHFPGSGAPRMSFHRRKAGRKKTGHCTRSNARLSRLCRATFGLHYALITSPAAT